MRKGILFSVMAMLCMPAAAASVQRDGALGASAAPDALYRVGQCIVRRDRDAAIALIGALPIDGRQRLDDAARLVADTGCHAGPLPAGFPVLLRGAMAQEMLQRDYSEFAGVPHNRARLVDFNLPVQSDGALADETARRYQWSDCVVRNDTENVERLIRTSPGSARERGILTRMAPYMSACMDDQARLSASPAEVRSLFMQSAYHMFYRFWNGELRGAGMAGVDNPGGRIACRTYIATDSRVRTERFCMSPRDWDRSRGQIREGMDKFLREEVNRRPT